MHDPSTVAFEIRYPWRAYRNPTNAWERKYRASFITIWHEDPLKFEGRLGCRDDDSCGWSRVPYSAEQRDRIRKLGQQQYSTIFGKQHAVKEGRDYARVCYEPSTYDAVYWTWRAINHQERRQGVWQYGTHLTARELQEIFELSSNPVDNLRVSLWDVKDEETCADWFMTVYRCWLRFNRPWYRHPRWHFWHWRFQVHPWQTFRRWAFSRCAGCGKRFPWGYSPVSHQWHSPKPKLFQSEVGSYHSECSNMTIKLQREPTKGAA